MKRLTTRLISMLLALVLCFQMLPLTALAALLDNDPAHNQEILDSLTEIVGSDDEAARYYAMLDQYGLLDEEGNLAESWEIWLDGEQVTLEDILALLEDPDCDLTKYVLVDGKAITLGEVQTILQIEEYITYLREKYFDGYQWTAEQQASLVSLLEQIEEEGIELFSEEAADASAIRTVGNGLFPIVTSYNDLSRYDGAEQIFDGDHVRKWYSTSGQSNSTEQPFPVWAQIELGTFVTVASYGIVTGDDRPDRDPSDWILYGSNDGENWTILDEQPTADLPQERGVEQKFQLAQSHTFRYFRYEIHARRGYEGSGYGIQLAELNFYDEDGNRIDLYAGAVGASGVNHGARVSARIDRIEPVITTKNDTPPAHNLDETAKSLFDGDPATKWYSTTVPTAQAPATIMVELAEPITAGSYGFVTANDVPERDPKQWTLYGSENGSSWTELDSESTALPENRNTETKWTITQPGSYRWFKLEIYAPRSVPTKNQGVQLADLNFYDADGNRIELTRQIFTAELTGAEPGQQVSYQYELLPGTQLVTYWAGTETMTADETGTASVTHDLTGYLPTPSTAVGTQDTRLSTTDLTFFVKLSDLDNALFDNGYPNTTVTGRSRGTVTNDLIGRVQAAIQDRTHTFTGNGTHTLSLTDENYTYAYGTALEWGLLNIFEVGPQDITGTTYQFEQPYLYLGRVDYKATANGETVLYNNASLSMVLEWLEEHKGWDNIDTRWLATSDAITAPNYELHKLYSPTVGGIDIKVTINGRWQTDFYETKQIGTWSDGSPYYVYVKYDLNPGAPLNHPTPPAYSIEHFIKIKTGNSLGPWVMQGAFSTAEDATYSPGHQVPVRFFFTQPVQAPLTMVINGVECPSLETEGYTNAFTFLYTVQEMEANTQLQFGGITTDPVGLSGRALDFDDYLSTIGEDRSIWGTNLSMPLLRDVLTDVDVTLDGESTEPALNVRIGIVDDKTMTSGFISEELDVPEGGTVFQTVNLMASIDGGETLYPLTLEGESATGGTLTASIPIPANLSAEEALHVVELYHHGKLLVGQYGTVLQDPIVRITEDDLTATISIRKKGTQEPYAFTLEDSGDLSLMYPYKVYPSDAPNIQATFQLKDGTDFTFDDTTKMTCYEYPADGWRPKDPTAHFAWSSNNPQVATIDENGVITLTGKEGFVGFYIEALNGGSSKAQASATYTIQALTNEDRTPPDTVYDTLHVGFKDEPFLTIPNAQMVGTDGQDATVFWSTNLYTLGGENVTTFTVTVKKDGETVYTDEVSGTAAKPVSKAVIPGEALEYDYNAGSGNTYSITVSCNFPGNGKYPAGTYTAEAAISLGALPAQVSLKQLESYYILDTVGTVPVEWTVRNLINVGDAASADVFKFQVTRNDDEIETGITLNTENLVNGTKTETYHLPIANITGSGDPAGYRDVYTVTVQAKNGADSTWSYDSFLLYVYDAEALKIWINGEDVGTGHTMSNIPEISKMSQEQILALNRDIYLKDVITVNYGEYAWTEVADQIVWAARGSSATLNYQQGALYENIEAYTYTSYRPTSELALAGLIDGQTTITATHKLTGMGDSLNVEVETLKDKLYLFQCYPQTTTTLTYTNGEGKTKTITSEATGAAAIYEPSGITGKVYCKSSYQGITYLGTFYSAELKTGEGNWTKLERYPCNNLTLRRAAYAYLYLKQPTGVPTSGKITFRGGVYVNGEYIEEATFRINGSDTRLKGDEDNTVNLDWDGKLTVTMDVTEWGLDNNELKASDDVKYVFQIEPDGNHYYPIIQTVDATLNHDSYVHSGSAVVSFRTNSANQPRPFIAEQTSTYANYNRPTSLLDYTGKVGPGSSLPEATIETVVMWWEQNMTGLEPSLQFVMADTTPLPGGTVTNSIYPFSDIAMTRYTTVLKEETIGDMLEVGQTVPIWLNYYQNGQSLSLQEEMPFRLCNMLGVEPVEESENLLSVLQNMGGFTSTNAANANSSMSTTDEFVNIALNLVASDSYTRGSDSMFSIQIAPTADPTKFLGLISVNVGDTDERDQVTGLYEVGNQTWDGGWEVSPGVNELMVLTGQKTMGDYVADMDRDIADAAAGKGERDLSVGLSGYAESLIYFDAASSNWKIQILSGGFNVSGGASYTWNWNTVVGVVPFTASLSIGGKVGIRMDALTVSYLDKANDVHLDNDFLTELRIYLYLKFFAGVGFDYSVMAFKLGIFGQIDVNMQFQWLNRPYLKTTGNKNMADGGDDPVMNGQSIKIDGTIGLEFVVRVLFISFEKVLWSQTFSLLNRQYNQWDDIQENWVANQKALQGAISELLNTGGVSVYNLNGRQMYSLNLAPTVEDRSYLENGVSLFALDDESALSSLDNEHYPYANPVVSNDGQLVGYLSDMDSPDVTMTRAAYGVMSGGAYSAGSKNMISENEGYGDSQLALAGTQNFAAAAWTRQTVDLGKAAGAVLTAEDQMMMMNGTEVYAATYANGTWAPVLLSQNNSAPDLAPVVAVSGERALVAWRSVSASGEDENITNFDQKDSIVYKLYSDGTWSDLETLYNGTSGAVKGITAAMMADGTAAVAYTLDADGDDNTLRDKDIYYAVVDTNGEVVRNVRATNDSYLDENPQLTAVTFPADKNRQHFVLGWYTEQGVAVDSAVVLASGDAAVNQNGSETTSDIRLIDITAAGTPGQLLPDSISQVADSEGVTITSNFRFTKSAASINDLSILWVERAEGTVQELEEAAADAQNADATLEAEKDVLKGVKFYTYGENSELIRFTGAIDVAEMDDGTLIDHFDAYVSNPAANEVKAVILGTTYGAEGTVTKTVTLADGNQAEIDVPSRSTAMYTATETYTDKIDVPAVLVDYDTVRKGSNIEIMFTVANKGIHAVNAVTITVGDKETTFNGLNILPGSSLRLYADYTVPEDKVRNEEYQVTATFDPATGAEGEATVVDTVSGTVYLARPDLKITRAEIIREENGKRDIRILLSNGADAGLRDFPYTVTVSFYTDATCETPLEGLGPVTVNPAYHAMIDEGGYSQVVTFDVKKYLALQELTEIPENGITIYMKAEVLATDGTVLGEPVTSNNFASVVCENLQARTSQDAIITSTLTKDTDSGTVTVSIQNTRLSQTSTGNIIVTVYDSNGEQLDQLQSFIPADPDGYGLMTLAGEAIGRQEFYLEPAYAEQAASVKVTYSDLILDDSSNAELDSLSFSAFPDLTLDDFVIQDDGTYFCELQCENVDSTIVQATAKSVSAEINSGGALYYENITLHRGSVTEIRLTVTSGDEEVQKTYVLDVDNRRKEQAAFYIDGPVTTTYGSGSIGLTAVGGEDSGNVTWTITSGEEFATFASASNTGSSVTLSVLRPGTVVVKAVKYVDNDYAEAVDTHTITIDKATVVSGNFTYTSPSNLTYSGAGKQALVSGKDGLDYGTITVGYYSDEALANVVQTPVAAGTYYVGITTTGDDCYHAVETPLRVGSFTITPKPITVTAEAKTMKYGENVPTLTYASEGLIEGDSFTGAPATDATKESNVGTYSITQGTLTAGANYTITFVGADLTIEKADGPAAPTVTGNHKLDGSTYTYIVTPISGAEYSMDGTTWQDSNVFTGLVADRPYTFYARIKETANVRVGAIGSSSEIQLDMLDGEGFVTMENWTYGGGSGTPVISSPTKNPVYGILYTSTDGKGYSSEEVPTKAGSYRVTVTFAPTGTHNGTTASADFTIAKATPNVTAPTGLTATYGDTLTSVTLPTGWAWKNMGTTAVGNAGTNSFDVVYTHPTDADNHEQVEGTVTITVSPKVVENAVTIVGDSFVYNGSAHTPAVVKDGTATIPVGEYTITYENNTNAGTAKVTVTDKEGGNYTVSGEATFTIARKACAAPSPVTMTFMRTIATENNEINVASKLPADAGTVTYTITGSEYSVVENVRMVDGTLFFDTVTSDKAAGDTIKVNVVMQNYTDVTLTVSVILNDKTPLEITDVYPATDLVYNGLRHIGYHDQPDSAYHGAYEITYTGRGSTNYNSTYAPVNAGDYIVTFKIPDSDLYYSGSRSLDFTIAKAKAAVTADDKEVHIGGELPTLTYTATGLIGNDSIDVQLRCEENAADIAGKKEIVITAIDPNGNYDITAVNGTLTVTDHVYENGTFHWQSDFSSATVTAACHCGATSASEPIPCEITSAWNDESSAVFVTATADSFRETKKIELSKSGNHLIITNSLADAAATVDNMLVMVAGYEDSGKMTGSQIIDTVTGVTEIPLTVTGSSIRVFFLRPGSFLPVVVCAELQNFQ